MITVSQKINIIPTVFGASIVLMLLFFSYQNVLNDAHADSSDTLSGYAWSDNIGWISFNCTNDDSCATSDYGVDVDAPTGNLSGYAWSDNIGWISFNSSDVSGCPSGTCIPNIHRTTGIASGWARALSNGGGWDGWISLSGVTADGQLLSGYAWGSDVVGWILMDGVVGDVNLKADPTGTIVANPNTGINGGSTSTISWTSQDALSCEVSSLEAGNTDSWTGLSNIGEETSPLYGDTTFVLICDSILVASAPIAVTAIPDLTASTRIIQYGGQVTLEWDTHNGNEALCELTGGELAVNPLDPSNNDNPAGDPNRGQHVIVINAKTTFDLVCPGGSDSVTVEVLPQGFET